MKLRILELTKEKGISQKHLAEQIKMTPVGLSKAINGNPTKDTLEKIASALGVPISELFEKPEENVIHCPNCGAELQLKKKDTI